MPLSGIRVIDAGSFIAGPAAATVMGDFGAEVIKIEPPEGDSYRRLGDSPGNPVSKDDYAWIVDSRNKKSLSLDLKQPAAREVLETLVRGADVFLTNMPLNVRTRLGIRWEDLSHLNERLIYASLSAYGEKGEEASKTGFDSTAWWARSGLMDNVRSAPDAPPARSLPGMGDHATAMSLFGAIMLALFRRERTGKGGMVSTSLMANGVWSNAFLAQAMLCGAPFRLRPKREEALNALNNLYEAADGRWFMLAMVSEERQWPGLVKALNRPELEADPRFATKADRIQNAQALVAELDAVFATKDYAHWRARMDENGVTFGSIAKLQDLEGDAQMRATDVLVPLEDPASAAKLTVNSPIFLEGTQKRPAGPAPQIGEHSDAVLASFGYDAAAIAKLRESGAVK